MTVSELRGIPLMSFVLLFGCTDVALPTRPSTQIDRESVRRDVRTVRDLARLDLAAVAADGARRMSWIVARIKPDECGYNESPSLTNGEDGTDRSASSAEPLPQRALRGADVRLIAVLTVPPRCVGRFEEISKVPDAVANEPRLEISEALYSPYRGAGGTVICRVNDGYPGIFRYRPAILIPDNWGTRVREAIDSVSADLGSQTRSNLPNDRSKILSGMNSNNPFVAIHYSRFMDRTEESNDAIAALIPKSEDAVLQGALTRIWILNRSNELDMSVAAKLQKIVDASPSFESVYGIGLGVCAGIYDSHHSATAKEVQSLVRSLESKVDSDRAKVLAKLIRDAVVFRT